MILVKFATEIKGDSNVADHMNWITMDSCQFGVGRSISSSGGGTDRDVSNPSFSEVTFAKSTDKASTELCYQAIQGKSLGKCEIHWVQTGADGKSQIYYTVNLEEAIVSSYSLTSGGDRPSESISVNFTKVTYKYDQFTGDIKETGDTKGWDLEKNEQFTG